MSKSPTGRVSSHRPNMQQIPMDSPEAKQLRESFLELYKNDTGKLSAAVSVQQDWPAKVEADMGSEDLGRSALEARSFEETRARAVEAGDPEALRGLLREAKHERDQYKTALDEWFDKTAWVQPNLSELGMHRADVLKQRVEELRKELRKELANPEIRTLRMCRDMFVEGSVSRKVLDEKLNELLQGISK